VIIICAWCEREGRPALIRHIDSPVSHTDDILAQSHGICEGHRLLFAGMLESTVMLPNHSYC